MCWVVTARTALVAIAASAALPPRCSICTPACAARWSTAQTMPCSAKREAKGPLCNAGLLPWVEVCPASHCQKGRSVVESCDIDWCHIDRSGYVDFDRPDPRLAEATACITFTR